MAQQIINIGSTVNDGTGDTLRTGAQKINANFAELYLTTLPPQIGNAGKFLTTDGTGTSWGLITDTITAAASQLTGTTLAPSVITSSLTSVGTLIDLTVTNTIHGSITGNAETVTNGVYTSIAYSNPGWLTSLHGSKIVGDIVGNSTGILGTIDGNSGQDIGVYKNAVYNNPSWINSLSETKVLPTQVGQSGKFLTTNGATTSWSTFANIPGGQPKQILYQSGIGQTAFVPAPVSNGTFLKWNGTAFEWSTTGVGQGTVTSVSTTGTVSGLTLTGGVGEGYPTGTITLGGSLTLTSGNITTGLGYVPAKLADFSVVVNSASGPGNLTYSTSTGVFTFTPPAPPVGTVSQFNFTDGNGFDGTVSTATSTPTLSLAMTVTGLLKGNGTGFTTAQAGTDYIAPYGNTAANYVFASPNATSGVPVFRPLVATDIPVLNQNTTGSAGKLTTARNINGIAFDGSSDITVTVPIGSGVTGISANVISFLTTPTSANLSTILSDETGSGLVVYNNAPTILSPTITTAISTGSTSFDLLTTNATTVNFASAASNITIGYTDTASSTTAISTGSVSSGETKTINIGTGGASGSTTNITFGSTSGGTITSNNNITINGSITMSGSGKIFSADFTNATVANRAYFKTTVLNGQTSLIAVPNGSSTDAKIGVVNNSAPTNSSRIMLATNGSTDVQLVSDTFGSGSYLPISVYTNGQKQVQVTTTGDLLLFGAGGIGYATGTGGAITQLTSRTTGVTLGKTNGSITLFSTTATLGTFTSFTVTNSTVTATDTVIVNMKSGSADSYIVTVSAVATGSFRVQIYNVVDVLVAEAPVLNFSVIKAVTA